MKNFDLVKNAQRGVFKDDAGHWVRVIGPNMTAPCGPVTTRLCEVGEGIAEYFSNEVGEKVRMCDIWPVVCKEDQFDVLGKYTVRLSHETMRFTEIDAAEREARL